MKNMLLKQMLMCVMAACVLSPALSIAAGLSSGEIASLTYMREEEKLARDVYTLFCAQYSHRTFCNIQYAEQRHMDAVKTMLDKYGLPDPAAGNGYGVFVNGVLQQLYNDLIASGSASLTKALEAGVAIEEVDIADLKNGLKVSTHADIDNVYSNLLNGSLNHLDAFESALSGSGGGGGMGGGGGHQYRNGR